jgi:acetyl-CoA carboxylase biotin carboxyl carrier protein
MPGKKRSTGKEASVRAWDTEEIQKLIDVLIKREITEFEFEKDGVKIRVKRGKPRLKSLTPVQNSDGAFNPPSFPSSQPASVTLHPTPAAPEPAAHESTEGLFMIKSPIVGTYYSSSSPNAPPFVKLGDEVQVGQVLCIIEAMKLMNEIESEVAGEVIKTYVENGQPVEYGQSLFAIRPAHKK